MDPPPQQVQANECMPGASACASSTPFGAGAALAAPQHQVVGGALAGLGQPFAVADDIGGLELDRDGLGPAWALERLARLQRAPAQTFEPKPETSPLPSTQSFHQQPPLGSPAPCCQNPFGCFAMHGLATQAAATAFSTSPFGGPQMYGRQESSARQTTPANVDGAAASPHHSVGSFASATMASSPFGQQSFGQQSFGQQPFGQQPFGQQPAQYIRPAVAMNNQTSFIPGLAHFGPEQVTIGASPAQFSLPLPSVAQPQAGATSFTQPAVPGGQSLQDHYQAEWDKDEQSKAAGKEKPKPQGKGTILRTPDQILHELDETVSCIC